MLFYIRGILKKLFPHQKKLWQNLTGKVRKIFCPIELCALITALLYYCLSPSIPQRHPFISLISPSKITHAEFVCISNPEKRGDSYLLTAQLRRNFTITPVSNFSCDASGNVLLYVPCEIIESLYPGRLFSKTSNKAVFEKGSILYCSVHYMYSKSQTHIFTLDEAEQVGWTSQTAYVRALLRLQFKRLMYAWNAAGALLLALLCGSREYLEQSVRTGFKNAGLSHILALSGMHLSFFSGLSEAASKKIAGKKISIYFSFFSVLIFVWFAGFSPSLLRAFLCSLLCLLCSFLYLKPKITSILALCFMLQICLSPQDGTCISFLLSYSALIGITTIGTFSYKVLIPYLPPKICGAFSASIGAQLCTIPFSLVLFGSITPVGIIASVIVSPLISIFLVIGLCGIIISLFLPFTSNFFASLLGGLYETIRFLVLLFSQIPPVSL